jgi:uncharacterized lipoprotein YajG
MAKLMITLIAATLLGACTTQSTTRSAADTKREADYATTIRNCDQLESARRATCIEDAKARYGHS